MHGVPLKRGASDTPRHQRIHPRHAWRSLRDANYLVGHTLGGIVFVVMCARLVHNVNHIQVSGFTDSGKDAWVRTALLYLVLTNPPDAIQFAMLDGKGGLSWIGWEKKAHTWMMADTEADIEPAMARLQAERERRQGILRQHAWENWGEYEGSDRPLIVVLVSELSLLETAIGTKPLEQWLTSELVSARASGIRDSIATQTVANDQTRWRSHIGV